MQGIDVSHWQSDKQAIDWAKVKAAGIDFAIIKAGYGREARQVDPYFEVNYKSCKANNIPVGCYWYSYADSIADAENEARACLSVIKGHQFEFPVYLDIEHSGQAGFEKSLMNGIVDKFCSTVQAAGYFVGWYTYTAWALNKFDAAALSKKYTFWLADYRSNYNKTLTRDIHQHTSTGHVDGILGNVDLDTCTRDFPSIIKKAGLNGFSKTGISIFTAKVSSGDLAKLKNFADANSIPYEVSQ